MEELILTDIWSAFRRRIRMIMGLAVLFAVAALLVSLFLLKPAYESRTTFIVSRPASYTSVGEGAQYNNDILMYQQLVRTYSEIMKSQTVLDHVNENLGLNLQTRELEEKINVRIENNSNIISLTVVDENAHRAKEIATEATRVFQSVIHDTMEEDNVTVFDKAQAAEEPMGPGWVRNTFIGGVLGFTIGLLIAIYQEFTYPAVRSARDFKNNFDLPVIGSIPKQ